MDEAGHFLLRYLNALRVSNNLHCSLFAGLKAFLRHEDLGSTPPSNPLQSIPVFPDDEPHKLVRDLDFLVGSMERIPVSDVDLRVRVPPVLLNDFLDHLLGLRVFLLGALHEDVPEIASLNFFLGDLDLGSALNLKLTDGLSTLANNQAHTVIGHRNDVGVGRRRPIRSHHRVIHGLSTHHRVINLGCHHQLLFSDFVSCGVICRDDSFDGIGCPSYTLCIISDD